MAIKAGARGSTVGVKLEVFGDVLIERKLLRFAERAGSARVAMLAIQEYLQEVEKKQFATEGAASGHPWAALADSTKRAKERAGLRPEILRATDALMKGLTLRSSQYSKRLANRNGMVFGVKNGPDEYGKILMGPPQGDSGHKQRKPVDLTETNKRVAVKIVQGWIMRGAIGKVPLP
jgi:hypothetical protein